MVDWKEVTGAVVVIMVVAVHAVMEFAWLMTLFARVVPGGGVVGGAGVTGGATKDWLYVLLMRLCHPL